MTAVDVDEVARYFFGLRAWRQLLAWHVPDELDRCRGCGDPQGSGPIWPCTLHIIATRAREIHEEHVAAITTHLGSIKVADLPALPPGVCHGCSGPSEGIICGACERAEREEREGKQDAGQDA